jgi:hypothetical protein
MKVRSAIESALQNLGILADEETAEVADLTKGLSALQSMLRLWAANRILVFVTTQEAIPLVGGQATYTWGTGGNIATVRPNRVLSAFVRDTSNADFPVDIISEGQYKGIMNKVSNGRPNKLMFLPSYPLACLYLYPTPDAAETLYPTTIKPFTETSSFAAFDDDMDFPPEYEEPIILNLTIRLSPKYGKAVSAEVAALASSGYETLLTLNSSRQVEPSILSNVLPAGFAHSTYNINNG